MGWIIVRGAERKPRYTAYYRGPDGRDVCAGTHDRKKDAEKAYRDAEAALRRNRWADPRDAKRPLEDYVRHTWMPATKPRVEISTWKSYTTKAERHILPKFGQTPIGQIRHTMVQGWVSELANKGVSPANVHHIMAVFKLIMKAAVKDEVIDSSPCTAVELRQSDDPAWGILQPRQALALIDALEELDPRWRTMVMLEMDLGARFSELRALRPRHFDPLRNRVTISETVNEGVKRDLDQRDANGEWPPGQYRIGNMFYFKGSTKTNQNRTVKLRPVVMDAVVDYIKDQGLGPDDFLFLSDKGNPVGSSWFREKIWIPTLQRAGLPLIRVHDLRHTVASWSLAGGATLAEVMKDMGHRQMQTAQKYLHLLDGEDNDAGARARDVIWERVRKSA